MKIALRVSIHFIKKLSEGATMKFKVLFHFDQAARGTIGVPHDAIKHFYDVPANR
jgi:hypothetical protein